MKAEQILEVLMDDKKYKAKIDEIRAEYARLIEVKRIADTLEAAKAIEAVARQHEQDALLRKLVLEEEHKKLVQKLSDEHKDRLQELDERASKERERYRDARELLVKAQNEHTEASKRVKETKDASDALRVWEVELNKRETVLRDRVTKINEALNG